MTFLRFIGSLVLISFVLFPYQNCAPGTGTGDPLQLRTVNLRFAAMTNAVPAANFCVTNVRLRVEKLSSPIANNSEFIVLPKSGDIGGFDSAYFYYDSTTARYYVNGVFTAKNVTLSQAGTDIAVVDVPAGTYDQVTFGFAACQVGVSIKPDIEVTNSFGTFADSVDSRFGIQYTGTKNIYESSQNGFDIEFLATQLQNVNSGGDLQTVLTPLRALDVVGMTSTPILGYTDVRLQSLARQADDKILAAGSANNGGWRPFLVTRYNQDGTLDPTFGNNQLLKGLTLADTQNGGHGATGIAVGSDDSIFVVGTTIPTSAPTKFHAGVLKLSASGTIDTTFGDQGWSHLSLSGSDTYGKSITVLPDGTLIVAALGAPGLALFKLASDGTLISSFGASGISNLGLTTYHPDSDMVLKVQSDNKIIVAGQTIDSITPLWFVARVNTNGSLDTSFNSDNSSGVRKLDFGGGSSHRATGLALQADGKILVTGVKFVNGLEKFHLVRLTTSGNIDGTFNFAGVDFGGRDIAKDVTIDSGGNILVGGSVKRNQRGNFAIAVFDGGGSPLTTVSPSGGRTYSSNQDEDGGVISLSPNGALALGGFTTNAFQILSLQSF
jgi:uncharacterized delta-60 repeat protein